MPPWRAKITPGELDDLIAYLVSLAPKGENLDFYPSAASDHGLGILPKSARARSPCHKPD